MTTDNAWFKANPSFNFYVRSPLPGEVDELAATMLPAGASLDAPFQPPSPDTSWQVLVVRLPLRRVARLLTLEPVGKERQPCFTLVPVAFGGRLAVA